MEKKILENGSQYENILTGIDFKERTHLMPIYVCIGTYEYLHTYLYLMSQKNKNVQFVCGICRIVNFILRLVTSRCVNT